MHPIKTYLVSLNQTPMDWGNNLKRIKSGLEEARSNQAELVVFPELSISGYGCGDYFDYKETLDQSLQALVALKPLTKGMLCFVGLPYEHEGVLYNCCAVLQDGSLVGIYPKKIMANDGVYYESRWFKPWFFGKTKAVNIDGSRVLFGDFTVSYKGFKVGMEICEEAWVEKTNPQLFACDVIVNLSASHFALGKNTRRLKMIQGRSKLYDCVYLYANLLGLEAGRILYDGCNIIGANGAIIAESKRFSFKDVAGFGVEVDVKKQKVVESVDRDSRDFEGPSHDSGVAPMTKNTEFLFAQSLCLFDYLRKSRARGYLVSLSGGCDSSSCAFLIASMVQLAVKGLGLTEFQKKLNLNNIKSVKHATQQLLHCVYMKTENNSDDTLHAAQNLAKEVGARFSLFQIDDLVDTYHQKMESMMKGKLSWEKHDVALQNIQARSRAPLVWFAANLQNFILISCSNRSEAALGYATMDGDTAGGLSPVAGVSKAFLMGWLEWAGEQSFEGFNAKDALVPVIRLSPSAELRPTLQLDEQELMPYRVAEKIEDLFLWNRLSDVDILANLEQEFKDYSAKQLSQFIQRFKKLWRQNQWKRERLAPGFHMDEFSVDPKTWARFPIISY